MFSSTDVPGFRECVAEDINGFFVPLGNERELDRAVEILIKGSDLRLKMGNAPRKRILAEMSLDRVIS